MRINRQVHSFHLVDPSPWPFISAMCAFFITFGGVLCMQAYTIGYSFFLYGFELLCLAAGAWWQDVIMEGTFEGNHTKKVKKGLIIGMLLFIVSEVMFFFAFFFAFFYVSLNPSHAIGGVWPPFALDTIDAFSVPFLNTVILLTSGATITVAHEALIGGFKNNAAQGFIATLILAVVFTGLQYLEYVESSFTISDSVYGSTFFLATGFHGFHVIIGTLFIAVCFWRLGENHYTVEHHSGFEAAAYYWHFVDVVWLFLFISIYWWGS